MQGWAAATAAASSIRSAARPVGQQAAVNGGHHGAHQCLQQPRCLFHNTASCSLELRARELRTRARRLVRTRRASGARRLTSRRASQAWSKIMDFIRCTGNDSRRGEPGRCRRECGTHSCGAQRTPCACKFEVLPRNKMKKEATKNDHHEVKGVSEKKS